jgi:hypothetical protein
LIIPGGAGTIGAVISEVSSFKFRVSSSSRGVLSKLSLRTPGFWARGICF